MEFASTPLEMTREELVKLVRSSRTSDVLAGCGDVQFNSMRAVSSESSFCFPVSALATILLSSDIR